MHSRTLSPIQKYVQIEEGVVIVQGVGRMDVGIQDAHGESQRQVRKFCFIQGIIV